MELNKLSIKDKPLFSKFLKIKRHELSVYAFENIYPWSSLFEIKWGIIKGSLCVFFYDKTGCFLYIEPLAKNIDYKVVDKCFEIMDSHNRNKAVSRIENIEQDNCKFFHDAGYRLLEKPCDFIFQKNSIAGLRGNAYKSKRASFNYFIKHYKFHSRDLGIEDIGACLKLYSSWAKNRRLRVEDRAYHWMIEDSFASLRSVLENYPSLGYSGRVVEVDGDIRAFTIGYMLNSDTFCIFFEIADLSIKGLAQFIFSDFCAGLKAYKYVNAMDDSGLDNLRKVKYSYRPLKLVPAYIAVR
ncbi:MAG: DUF2156 domain-containing protein [Candidatus Omnitrophota bacterium]|jgi:hypothetical protein|nr:MAG: DUF2156 domain-containing protein [Candidatus Omnitrophota bacterium]